MESRSIFYSCYVCIMCVFTCIQATWKPVKECYSIIYTVEPDLIIFLCRSVCMCLECGNIFPFWSSEKRNVVNHRSKMAASPPAVAISPLISTRVTDRAGDERQAASRGKEELEREELLKWLRREGAYVGPVSFGFFNHSGSEANDRVKPLPKHASVDPNSFGLFVFRITKKKIAADVCVCI
jgi:hypothetical protein